MKPKYYKIHFSEWLDAMAVAFEQAGGKPTDEEIQQVIQQSGSLLMQNEEGCFVMMPVEQPN